ncbi:MAG TPA: FAD-dependent oxidoreductase, partial [bacterium]|nr:FAD-dependent oxidoreductase [bacterium]
MSKTRVFINGKKVFADAGRTILEVVHEHQIDHIPNLCLEQQLKPYNSCFLCLVQVKGVNKLVPACSTVIREDMEITTRNAKIMDGRRASLELLLSNHFADCLPPCSMRCPAGVDVQGYIAHIANGDYQEAVRVIKQTNPLPAICGRVCTRPCELACRRNILDSNVKIDFLKRFASDVDMYEALRHVTPELAPDKDRTIAVIGAGPAGLSAAYYLRLSGYRVTIFEGMPEPGGMLRYGIPEYRLPYDVLDREIDTILELGVTLKTNTMLGEDLTIRDLFNDGFDAVFLGIGAWGSRSLGVQGQDAEGVLSGIKFLEELGRGRKPDLYGKVVVVGGGNTAVDCARTSLRLDADKVTLLYRRTRKEMPANEMEIDAAEHEGVEMHFLAAPVEVITENNRVKALKCIKMELGAPDASGRRRPVPIPDSDFIVEADFVFAAIGQNPMADVFQTDDPDFLPENGRIKLTRWESVIVNPDTFETDTDAVFAGGDMVTGAATVIEAIAAGRKAAHAINSLFTDGFSRGEPVHFNSKKDDYVEVECRHLRYDTKLEAHEMPELAPKERIRSFDEVELGYTEDTAREESARCLECGCDSVFVCKLREYATEYGVTFGKFKGAYGEHELDRSHPFIELDQNKCILCGRCIRVCSEIVGESVYG